MTVRLVGDSNVGMYPRRLSVINLRMGDQKPSCSGLVEVDVGSKVATLSS